MTNTKYKYTIAYAEDFVAAGDSTESIDNEQEGINALARINDNTDGEKFILLRSDENDTVFAHENNKWVKYG